MKKQITKIIRLWFLFGAAVGQYQCDWLQQNQKDQDLLAVVNGRRITRQEFIQRAEFSPPPRFRSLNGKSGKEGLLEWLIIEKLLAQEAERIKLDTTLFIREQMKLVQLNAMLRQLYRQEIQRQVTVDSSEIKAALNKLEYRFLITLFLTTQKKLAKKLRTAWVEGEHPDRLLKKIGAETRARWLQQEVSWGDLEEPLERALYALQPGEISPVIRFSRGCAVFRIERSYYQPILTATQLQQKLSAIVKLLRFRKMDSLAAVYVADYMNRQNVVVKQKILQVLLAWLEEKQSADQDKSIATSEDPVRETAADRLKLRLQAHMDDPFITFRDGFFTLREILIKLQLRGVHLNRRSASPMRKQLLDHLKIIARDELLGREARRKGLDRHPAVRRETNMWRDYYLARALSRKRNIRLLPGQGAETHLDIHLPDALLQWRRQAEIYINRALLDSLSLSGIPMVAIRRGNVITLAVPPWQL